VSWRSLLLAGALVAGCAAPAVRPPDADLERAWRQHAAGVQGLTDWDMRGRLALRSADDGGQAGLRWVRRADDFQIDLSGPLGRGLLRLTRDNGGVRLVDGERHEYRAASAEALLYDTTGWHIPLDDMHYWIRGLPVPSVPREQELDADGRLSVLRQSGWEIRYLAYARYGRYALPARVTLTSTQADGHAAGPVEARVVIERWELPNAGGP
jgi:outer membrane lipoprotein LolB